MRNRLPPFLKAGYLTAMLYLAILLLTTSCSQPEEFVLESKGELRLPTIEQLEVDLPRGMVTVGLMDTKTLLTASDLRRMRQLKDGKKSDASPTRFVEINEGNITTTSTWALNPFTLGVDPDLEGEDGPQEDGAATQGSCTQPDNLPNLNSGVPPNGRVPSPWCFSHAIQLALKRIVSEYSTTITIITSQAHFFNDTEEGVVSEFVQPAADIQGGELPGLKVSFFYECVDAVHCGASVESVPLANRDYRYVMTFQPLHPKPHFDETIGRIEWTMFGDGSMSGKLIVGSGLMSPSTISQSLQVIYEFSSDAEGNSKQFTMRYHGEKPSGEVDEFVNDPMLVRLERRSFDDGRAPVWIAQGKVRYSMFFDNPSGGGYNYTAPFSTSMLFTVVAEDELVGGRAMYNAVLTDFAGALPKPEELANDSSLTTRCAHETSPLQNYHVWAAYKCIAELLYNELYFSTSVNGDASQSVALGSLTRRIAESEAALDRSQNMLGADGMPGYHRTVPRSIAEQNEDLAQALDIDSSADSRWVITGSADGTLAVFDMDTPEPLGETAEEIGRTAFCTPHGQMADGSTAISGVSLSNDSTHILTVGVDGYVQLVNREDCGVVASTYIGDPDCVAESSFYEYRMEAQGARRHLSRVEFIPNSNNEFYTVSPGVGKAVLNRWEIVANAMPTPEYPYPYAFDNFGRMELTDMAERESGVVSQVCMGAKHLDISHDFEHRYFDDSLGDDVTVEFAVGRYALVSLHDATARVWDSETNTVLTLRHRGEAGGIHSVSTHAVFNKDASKIYSGVWQGERPGFFVWDGITSYLGLEGGIERLPDEEQFMAPYIVRAEWEEQVREAPPSYLVFSKDYKRLLYLQGPVNRSSAGWGNQLSSFAVPEGGLRLEGYFWDRNFYLVDGRAYSRVPYTTEIQALGHRDHVMVSVGRANDSRWPGEAYLKFNNIQTMRTTDLFWPRPFIEHARQVTRTDFSEDGGRLLTAGEDGLAVMWRYATGTMITRYAGHDPDYTEAPLYRGVRSAVFVDQDRKVLTAGYDKTARLWDDEGNLLYTFKHPDHPEVERQNVVHVAQADPGFNEIVTGARDGVLRFWQLPAANFDGDMNCQERELRQMSDGLGNPLFDEESGEPIMAMLPPPDLVCTHDREFVRQQDLQTLSAHDDEIRYVAVSPDGMYVVSVGADSYARVWNFATGDLVAEYYYTAHLVNHRDEPYEDPAAISYVEFSPLGDRLVIATMHGDAVVLRVSSLLSGDVENAEVVRVTDSQRQAYNTAVFSRNAGSTLLFTNTFSAGGNRYPIDIWDIDEDGVMRDSTISEGFGTRLIQFRDDGEVQNRRVMRGVSVNPVSFAADDPYSLRFAAGFPGTRNTPDPSMWDHDGTWINKRTEEALKRGRWALSSDRVNPYYLEPAVSHDMCYMRENDEVLCAQFCEPCEMSCSMLEEGCSYYKSVSTMEVEHAGVDSGVDLSNQGVSDTYNNLKRVLDDVQNSDEAYYFEDFESEEILPIEVR